MTDATFQKLVSLYLDGEITPAEEARLAQEVRDNPERRAEFHRYRRFHLAASKACREHQEVFAGCSGSTRRSVGYYRMSVGMMGGALAACAVFIAIERSSDVPIGADALLAEVVQPPAPTARPHNAVELQASPIFVKGSTVAATSEAPLLHRTWEDAQIELLRSLKYEAVVYEAAPAAVEAQHGGFSIFESGLPHGSQGASVFAVSHGSGLR